MFQKDAIATSFPVAYLAFLDYLSHPMQLAGFVFLLLQIIYVSIKIRLTLKGKKDAIL